jgi:hypothetical protein
MRDARRSGHSRDVTTRVCLLAALVIDLGCRHAPAPEGDVASLVHAAVLRYEAKQLMSEERLPACVAIHGSSGGIDSRLREALHPSLPDVRPADACAIVDGEVFLAGSRVPAALLSSGPIRWIADDEAQVTGGFARTRWSTLRSTYRVVRDAGRWVCLGPVVTGVPL